MRRHNRRSWDFFLREKQPDHHLPLGLDASRWPIPLDYTHLSPKLQENRKNSHPVESGNVPDCILKVPLLLAKTGVFLRWLAKAEKVGRIIENLGKNRLFGCPYGGFSHGGSRWFESCAPTGRNSIEVKELRP
jgi:hypothetical protein